VATVNLWAKDGYMSTPDGNSIYFWGFTGDANRPAQLPGPRIVITQGQEVTVNLTNTLAKPVSIVFPGQRGVLAGGQPVQPQYDAERLVSFADYAPPNGGTVTYTFTAEHPGTYIYESGTYPYRQVPMGLYGGLVVRPADFDADTNKTAYGAGTDTGFDREYLLITGEIDPKLHRAVEQGKACSAGGYRPRYWTVNGRCAPDTMMKDSVPYLPRQPYGSMIMAERGERVLIRYIGAGVQTHPLHPHGNHTRVIAVDGRLLRNGEHDRSYNRFTVLVEPGRTYDQIFRWDGLGYSEQNPIPTILPNLRNMGIGDAGWTLWSGSPYLGQKGDIPVGVVSHNELGEYYFMLHSHAEPQITNWGEFPGGMMSMIAVYPSLSPVVGTLP